MDKDKENRPSEGVSRVGALKKIFKKIRWKKALKWVLIPTCVILFLLAAVISVAVWLLSPNKLTPMVEEYSSKYLDANVMTQRVELSFWSTFPKVSLRVDSLTVVSKALGNVQDSIRDKLPADADTLLTLKSFDGAINVMALMDGCITLYDVTFTSPKINLVQVNDSIANYMIVPPSESDSTESSLPQLSIEKFAIEGGAPIRFFSLQDSVDLSVRIGDAVISGNEAPSYAIGIDGSGKGELMPGLRLEDLNFGVDGRIDWNQHDPMRVGLKNFKMSVNNMAVEIDTKVNFEKSLIIEELKISSKDINIGELIAMIPPELAGELKKMDTDLLLSFSGELLQPYDLATSALPAVKANLKIPRGSLNYQRMALRSVKADIEAVLPDGNPDLGELKINEFEVKGKSLSYGIKGVVKDFSENAFVDGSFHGELNTATLPKELWTKLKWRADGILSGKAKMRFYLSDFNPNGFHNVKINGNLALKNFSLVSEENDMSLMTRNMEMALGTDAKMTIADTLRADSLMRISLKADTLAYQGEGLTLSASDAGFVIAVRNVAGSLDTTKVNPLGIAMRAARVTMVSDSDSVRLSLRKATVRATLKRYRNSVKVPQLGMDMSMSRMRYRDAINSMSLTDASASLTIHPSVRNRNRRTNRAESNSVSGPAQTESVKSDSTVRKSRTNSRTGQQGSKVSKTKQSKAQSKAQSKVQSTENMNFGVNSDIANLLRKWKAQGSVKARRGRLVTPYFPARNTLRNFDMDFSTDSVIIRNTDYILGKSNFTINGSIRNITRALTSRRGSPLKVDFNIKSDTININEIYETMSAGSTFAERLAAGQITLVNTEDEDAMQKAIEKQADNYEQPALIIPGNIDANLRVRAKNVRYADIWFQRFDGRIGVHDGAVQLDRLAGYTPIGSMDMTALYSAPCRDSIEFAAGMLLRKLRLKEFLRLMPQVDSVLPLLKDISGIVTADMAMSSRIDSMMNFDFKTFNLALKLSGDSLVLLDSKTYQTMAKWLMFKKKDNNLINSMKVELMIKDSKLDVFPFVFDFDRYRIGVSGHNTLDMDLDYHVAVLKSPLPFKFGVNIKGTPDDMKIRLGKANFDEKKVSYSRELTDTVRMNLVNEIRQVFSLGARLGRRSELMMQTPKPDTAGFEVSDTLTAEDSLIFIQNGVIESPVAPTLPQTGKGSKSKKKRQ